MLLEDGDKNEKLIIKEFDKNKYLHKNIWTQVFRIPYKSKMDELY